MLPAITRSPVFQILCVTGRMTLLCSFCTCPSKNGSSAIGVPFSSVLHTFHPKSIPLSTISTDFAVFQASSNEGENASAEPSAEAKSKSRPQSTDRVLPPAVLFSVLHCRHQTRPPRAETVPQSLRYTRCQIRGGKHRHSAKQCSAEEKQITQKYVTARRSFPSLSHHAFQAVESPPKRTEINAPHRQQPISNENPCHTGQAVRCAVRRECQNAGQSRTSTIWRSIWRCEILSFSENMRHSPLSCFSSGSATFLFFRSRTL